MYKISEAHLHVVYLEHLQILRVKKKDIYYKQNSFTNKNTFVSLNYLN